MKNKYDTHYVKKDEIVKDWLVVDAGSQNLGRLASQVASLLRGKHKTNFQPSMDTGDYVIVINASKINITGRKFTDKVYHRYTGYPGGIKSKPFSRMIEDSPERIIQLAVKRMLPQGRIGRAMMKKLFVYAGDQHKHQAQKPKVFQQG